MDRDYAELFESKAFYKYKTHAVYYEKEKLEPEILRSARYGDLILIMPRNNDGSYKRNSLYIYDNSPYIILPDRFELGNFPPDYWMDYPVIWTPSYLVHNRILAKIRDRIKSCPPDQCDICSQNVILARETYADEIWDFIYDAPCLYTHSDAKDMTSRISYSLRPIFHEFLNTSPTTVYVVPNQF